MTWILDFSHIVKNEFLENHLKNTNFWIFTEWSDLWERQFVKIVLKLGPVSMRNDVQSIEMANIFIARVSRLSSALKILFHRLT